jgi:hypothetical protein
MIYLRNEVMILSGSESQSEPEEDVTHAEHRAMADDLQNIAWQQERIIDGETLMLLVRISAREIFEIIKAAIDTSDHEVNLWNVLMFLAECGERSEFIVSTRVNSAKLSVVFEHNFNNEYISLFAKELLAIMFYELGRTRADVSELSNNIVKLQFKHPLNNTQY